MSPNRDIEMVKAKKDQHGLKGNGWFSAVTHITVSSSRPVAIETEVKDR